MLCLRQRFTSNANAWQLLSIIRQETPPTMCNMLPCMKDQLPLNGFKFWFCPFGESNHKLLAQKSLSFLNKHTIQCSNVVTSSMSRIRLGNKLIGGCDRNALCPAVCRRAFSIGNISKWVGLQHAWDMFGMSRFIISKWRATSVIFFRSDNTVVTQSLQKRWQKCVSHNIPPISASNVNYVIKFGLSATRFIA